MIKKQEFKSSIFKFIFSFYSSEEESMIEEKSAKGKKDRKKKKEKSISEDVEKVIFFSTLWFDGW